MPRTLATNRTKTSGRTLATSRRAVASFNYSLVIRSASNQYGSMVTPSFATNTSRTIEWWSKFITVPSGTSPIFSLAAANYYAGFTTGSMFASYSDASLVQRTHGIANPLTAGEWNHWAITVDTSGSDVTEKFYRNGTLLDTYPLSGGHSGAYGGFLFLGTFTTGSGGFDGLIAKLSFYNRALSGTEILNRSNNIEVLRGLSERWNFSEGSGSSLTGINGTVFTLANSPAWSSDVPCKNRTIVT